MAGEFLCDKRARTDIDYMTSGLCPNSQTPCPKAAELGAKLAQVTPESLPRGWSDNEVAMDGEVMRMYLETAFQVRDAFQPAVDSRSACVGGCALAASFSASKDADS